ncbi:MAG: peptide-N-glycosidase F-related protein, partial [Bacteroidota bacterium]
LREMTSGHGWGDLNTGNAAEFRESTHHFKVNGTTEFTQHLWTTCNPNPVSCQPQNGTWFYNRSGWCPGSIPMLWRFDLSSRIGTAFELMYELDTTYRDYCSPYNPDCVTGVTCSDCDNMYNPNLKVAGEIITYFDDPPIPNWTPVSVNSPEYLNIRAYPNPSGGTFKLTSSNVFNKAVLVQISNITGVVVKQWYWNGEPEIVDISNVASGLYFIKVTNDKNLGVTKIIIQ